MVLLLVLRYYLDAPVSLGGRSDTLHSPGSSPGRPSAPVSPPICNLMPDEGVTRINGAPIIFPVPDRELRKTSKLDPIPISQVGKQGSDRQKA